MTSRKRKIGSKKWKSIIREAIEDYVCNYLTDTAKAQKILNALQDMEQEPVLDKIRAEITDWQTDIHDNEYDAETHDFVFERIYEIIDKYKAESEK